ncbi:hypothetical protein [Actinomadura sp. WMMB 499]|uniref:hypothetical protein n=1 Tax=Actinomadura sp. WMMB 499 TaxID=1219491 RepID=UPI0012442B73|nr:hypothetical protein [Actinomadura sp. WMMB 499]QFG25452.1 hypothetical protein F7P10_34110 [Actinomadura sp. WMMB 499]
MAEAFANGTYTDSQVGHPLQGTDNLFIPELWTAQYLTDLEATLILGSSLVTNRNYEGEFRRNGDVLHIPHFLETVRDFGTKKAYGAFSADEMDHSELEYIKLTVQKGSSFRFEVDSLHQLQTQAGIDLMSDLIRQRARRTSQAIDALVAQTITAAVEGKDLNSTTSKTIPTVLADFNALTDLHGSVTQLAEGTGASWVYEKIVDMVTELDNVSAPQDRYLIVAPSIRAALLKDPNFTDASNWGGGAVMPTGVIGQILGVPVYVSNILKNASTTSGKKLVKGNHTGAANISMLMGSTNAVSLVMPHAELAAYNPEDGFTSAVKSRLIYDAKVIRPEQLVVVGDYAAPAA